MIFHLKSVPKRSCLDDGQAMRTNKLELIMMLINIYNLNNPSKGAIP